MTLDEIMAQTLEEGDCVLWTGRMGTSSCKTTPIYKSKIDGHWQNIPVCRKVWEFTRGPIPAGKIIYRSCCNDRCLGCLVLGVRGDAMRLRKKLGLSKHSPSTRASLTSGARGRSNIKHTIEQAREVRALLATGLPRVEISHRTGVTRDAIGDIATGRAWRETSYASSVFSWRPAA